MSTISCGVVIQDADGNILLGHMTNLEYWDFPKGKMEEGESTLDAAVRETFEETNISLNAATLSVLSEPLPYRKGKRLALFNCTVDTIHDQEVKCNSIVTGRTFPEFDDFKFVKKDELSAFVSPAMWRYLNKYKILDLIQ